MPNQYSKKIYKGEDNTRHMDALSSLHIKVKEPTDFNSVIKTLHDQIQELKKEIDKSKKEIDNLKKENIKLSLRMDMIELGNMTHQLKQTIIDTIFNDKPINIRHIIEIQDCAYSKSPIKMGDDDLARWLQFVKALEKKNITTKELDKDMKRVVYIRNSVAHPPVMYN